MRKVTKKESELLMSKKNINIITKKEVYKGFKGDKRNVIIIADTQEPFCKDGYMDFVLDTQKKWNAGTVIHIGDELDLCALSQYSHDPDGMSAGDEIRKGIEKMKEWYKAFPNVKICTSNHGSRVYRKAKEAGIPKDMIKSYNEMFQAPKTWTWADSWDLYDVHYTHGTNSSGAGAAIRRAVLNQENSVQGHLHSECSIQYSVSKKHRLFGMIVGSGIDDQAYAFYYGKDMPRKSVISCGLVLEAGKLPILELMKL
jgi:hypothetical protein